MIEGQEPTVLAVGAGVGRFDIFTRLLYLFSFSLSLEDGSILTEIMSQRTDESKQPTNLVIIYHPEKQKGGIKVV